MKKLPYCCILLVLNCSFLLPNQPILKDLCIPEPRLLAAAAQNHKYKLLPFNIDAGNKACPCITGKTSFHSKILHRICQQKFMGVLPTYHQMYQQTSLKAWREVFKILHLYSCVETRLRKKSFFIAKSHRMVRS